jgi:hypothetical protein
VRTAEEAVRAAKSLVNNALVIHPGWCDHYCAQFYGLPYSGYASASTHFLDTPSEYRHGFGEPPLGALCYWSGGNEGKGHIALSAGNGWIVTTDFPKNGYIGEVPRQQIAEYWRVTYQGYTDAYYGDLGLVIV